MARRGKRVRIRRGLSKSRGAAGLAILALFVGALGGCAKRPVLYPNDHLQQVGEEASKRDIEECMTLADNANLDDDQALEAGKKTAGGAAVGGVTGAAAGAISGRPGMGAAIGATTGAIGGFFAWMFGSSEPDPIYKRYVDICLQNRGYQSIGWK